MITYLNDYVGIFKKARISPMLAYRDIRRQQEFSSNNHLIVKTYYNKCTFNSDQPDNPTFTSYSFNFPFQERLVNIPQERDYIYIKPDKTYITRPIEQIHPDWKFPYSPQLKLPIAVQKIISRRPVFKNFTLPFEISDVFGPLPTWESGKIFFPFRVFESLQNEKNKECIFLLWQTKCGDSECFVFAPVEPNHSYFEKREEFKDFFPKKGDLFYFVTLQTIEVPGRGVVNNIFFDSAKVTREDIGGCFGYNSVSVVGKNSKSVHAIYHQLRHSD